MDYLGTAAFNLSGGLKGARYRLDIFGLIVISTITGIGGGVIRDVFLGTIPPLALRSGNHIALGVVSGVVVFFMKKYVEKEMKLLLVLDAIGLGIFTITGTDLGMSRGLGIWGSVTMGCLTGVGGGVIRDLLVNEIPIVLRKEIYALAGILGGIMFYILSAAGVEKYLAIAVSVAAIVAFRLFSIWNHIEFPRIEK